MREGGHVALVTWPEPEVGRGMKWARAAGERLCRRVRGAEALRETCRQYPLFCCLLLGLSLATLLLSR
ncbi:hypothetical protein JD844_024146 [Phrynosoma platyrhinos]|uniref:Uncharacterized protein n=1 Tax=Phrynosoma platyrhinos TaxID=52577 RepID=A0ABQ7SXJ3_PHRPL|nr:hypothetical protein JD844_024146 [Phrynosoma platyrhinos]